MDFLRMIDNVLVFKTKTLSIEERKLVIDEICRVRDLLKPLGLSPYGEQILGDQSDKIVVEVLYEQYQLLAFKHLNH